MIETVFIGIAVLIIAVNVLTTVSTKFRRWLYL